MNRRRWLMGLVVADALCWVINVAPSLIGGWWNPSIVINGRMLSGLLFGVMVVLFPMVIGAFCTRWQAAVALPVIAAAPAILVSLVTTPVTVQNVQFLVLLPAALGGVGWLLRYARAEFAA